MPHSAPPPDLALAERLFAALQRDTFDGVGITREAYGGGEAVAHALVQREALAAGLEIAIDAAGNLLMTLPGRDRTAPVMVLGSHLDSVPQGGNYDGAAGVLAGLAVAVGLRRAGIVPPRDLVVLAVRAEESGAWFPTSFPGSRAALGTLAAEALAVRRSDSGRTLAEHMAEEGFDPASVRAGATLLPPSRIGAYVELHIEQGPVLEAEGQVVGIVTGIPGARRLRAAKVIGEYNHSGATPRRFRCDAAIALAELATQLDAHWAALDAQGRPVVVTFCTLGTTARAGFGKVAGEAEFSLDVRSVDAAASDAVFAELH